MAAAESECLKSQNRSCAVCYFPLIFESNKGCLQYDCLLEFKYTLDETNGGTEPFFRLTVLVVLVAIWKYRILLQARHKARVLEKQKTETFTMGKAQTFPAGRRCPSTEQLFCATKDTAKVVSVYKLSFLLMVFCKVFNI